jgi:hypothetical protein
VGCSNTIRVSIDKLGMTNTKTSLAVQLLMLYWSGMTVSAISAFTGLSERGIMERLFQASHGMDKTGWTVLDCEGGLGVRWEYVFWRG